MLDGSSILASRPEAPLKPCTGLCVPLHGPGVRIESAWAVSRGGPSGAGPWMDRLSSSPDVIPIQMSSPLEMSTSDPDPQIPRSRDLSPETETRDPRPASWRWGQRPRGPWTPQDPRPWGPEDPRRGSPKRTIEGAFGGVAISPSIPRLGHPGTLPGWGASLDPAPGNILSLYTFSRARNRETLGHFGAILGHFGAFWGHFWGRKGGQLERSFLGVKRPWAWIPSKKGPRNGP